MIYPPKWKKDWIESWTFSEILSTDWGIENN